ncbi:helix-turn-helix domain-containing protein [Streptomyces sp. NPDC050416]|uniref:helix-turn-helix domain-containing protein n=1 Tax=Streptomyces sp. NPDC050416 TaxID=3365611 RepID=UPI00379B07DF
MRRLRKDAGRTLEYVARRVNYSKGHLSKVERGDKKPTEALARRCDALFRTGGRLERLLRLTTAYKRARCGEFRCRVRKEGGVCGVGLRDLMRALGIQDVRVRYDGFEAGARLADGGSPPV